MDASIWIAWIVVSVATGTLAALWKGRSWFLWAALAAVAYAFIEDPPLRGLISRPRFAPSRDDLLATIGIALAVFAVAAVALSAIPRASSSHRRRRRYRRSLPALEAGEEAKQCPSCVETVSARASVCPFCGHKFTVEAVPR
jgi:hypothetical protein